MKMTKLPHGFLSSGINPTQNAVMMYAVYFKNGGTDDHQNINPQALQAVRDYFNFEGGKNSFKTMLQWGLDQQCVKSHTSSNQALAMRTAKVLGQIIANNTIIK
jgi:hypothetical protein